MNVKRTIKTCTITLISLFAISSISQSSMSHIGYAHHVRRIQYIRKHKHHYSYKHSKKQQSQHAYSYIIRLIQSRHHKHSYRRRVNHIFASNKGKWSARKLINLQHHFHIYKILYSYNKRYYMHKFHLIHQENMHKKFISAYKLFKLSHQDNRFDTRLRKDMIKEINRTRRRHHVPLLIVTNEMQRTANYRNAKVLFAYEHPLECRKYEHVSLRQLKHHNGTTDGWIHGIDNHTSGNDYLTEHGYNPRYWGANATDWFHTYYCTNNDGTLDKYPDTTPSNIAYDINNDFMNHDKANGNNNGHRKNELNPHYKYLGVGVNYNRKTKMGSLNEQFAS